MSYLTILPSSPECDSASMSYIIMSVVNKRISQVVKLNADTLIEKKGSKIAQIFSVMYFVTDCEDGLNLAFFSHAGFSPF